MPAAIQLLDSSGSHERTIMYDGDIHPYHVLQSKVHTAKSEFIWYLRESPKIGIIYVDFFRSEKTVADNKATITWSYYSIPFGLQKTGWEIIDPKDPAQVKLLLQINAKNSSECVQELLHKLETMNLTKLRLIPEIPKLMQFEKEYNQQAPTKKNTEEDLYCTAEYRLNPIDKHSANRSFIYSTCSKSSLEQAAVLKKIRFGETRKSLFSRLLGLFIS